jgi:hypothetical protein
MAWVVVQTIAIGTITDAITTDTADMETDTAETIITAITAMDMVIIMEMDMETVLIPEITTETKRQVIHTLETMEEV